MINYFKNTLKIDLGVCLLKTSKELVPMMSAIGAFSS